MDLLLSVFFLGPFPICPRKRDEKARFSKFGGSGGGESELAVTGRRLRMAAGTSHYIGQPQSSNSSKSIQGFGMSLRREFCLSPSMHRQFRPQTSESVRPLNIDSSHKFLILNLGDAGNTGFLKVSLPAVLLLPQESLSSSLINIGVPRYDVSIIDISFALSPRFLNLAQPRPSTITHQNSPNCIIELGKLHAINPQEYF